MWKTNGSRFDCLFITGGETMDPVALAIMQSEGTITFWEKIIIINEQIKQEERNGKVEEAV